MFNLFGGPFSTVISSNFSSGAMQWLKPIVEVLDDLIIPITIIVAIAGAIWVIILGVKLARAETADKAQEAKKALINVAIAIVASLVVIWLLVWFASSLPSLTGSQVFDPISSTFTN